MMKYLILLIALTGIVSFWTNSLQAQFSSVKADAIEKPVVIELFTSQSCSSCPPADRNLGVLSQNPNVIALGFHVTYWNHLHWEDTLSNEFSTHRQRAYATYKRNGRVYTPQMIVNGDEEFVGSRSGDIAGSLKRANDIQPITIKSENTELTVTLPEIEEGPYVLYLAGTKDHYTQDIPSGENRGRTVEYHNAVLEFKRIGSWTGQDKTLTLETFENTDIDHYVILAQKSGYGPIVAAGKTN